MRLASRRSRGAALTKEGELLLERATFLLRYTDQTKVDIADVQGQAARFGRVRRAAGIRARSGTRSAAQSAGR